MRRLCTLALLGALLSMNVHAALDLDALWDYADPARSEQRFRDALAGASADEALILQTQIARSHGLRRDFDKAREILAGLEPALAGASAEAQVRYALELGRSYASATHSPQTQTSQTRERARAAFQRALDLARAARLDGLAIDAIHMFAFVDPSPEEQLKRGREALAVIEASDQPAAKRWEASVRNNTGVALHELGRYGEALDEFQRALVLRERGSDAEATRAARWMIAWTLRALGRRDEAIAMQLQLERDCDAAQAPDEYVYAELVELYKAGGEAERARHYEALLAKTRPAPQR